MQIAGWEIEDSILFFTQAFAEPLHILLMKLLSRLPFALSSLDPAEGVCRKGSISPSNTILVHLEKIVYK